jgi:SAM-dependent methyltransferase
MLSTEWRRLGYHRAMSRTLPRIVLDRLYRYRARWSARRLQPWLASSDRVLDIGAGDCLLDAELAARVGCTVEAVDVADANRTARPLQLFDGKTLPFADGAFDVGLLLFVLHHADDPATLLGEAKRVCRRRLIAFEDDTTGWWNRQTFRGGHSVYSRVIGLPFPKHEWPPAAWSALAGKLGLRDRWRGPIGRQGGYLSPRHIMYVWEPAR